MSSVPERSEIDERYKWDLESIYGTDSAWETAHDAVEGRLDDLGSYAGRLDEGGETLLAALAAREEVMREVSKLAAYARMRSDEDKRDQAYQALSTRARSLASAAQSAASYVEPELQSMDPDRIEAVVGSTEGLEVYAHYLDDVMRLKDHTRSAEVEGLLADLGEVLGAAGEAYNLLLNADLTFPTVEDPDGEPVEITQSNLVRLLKEPDRAFRRRVYESFFDELEAVRNTVGATLKNSVRADVKLARVRGYGSAREAAMDGPNIPEAVYDTLLETVEAHLPTLHRHARLKRRCLDVDELRMWDLYMPMTAHELPDIDYDRAVEYVVGAVAPLGEEYQARVAEGLESNWVDVYENRGKQSGAYSGGTYDTQPFILMNYQDELSDVFTLAHELGHSLHSEFASEHQPYVYSDYEIFVAEVASTVNESLLTHHLLETVEDARFRRHVLNEYLERLRSTLFRQTMFADFEHRIHAASEAGEALTPDRLDETYRELKEAYYEPVVPDDHLGREWMRIPHFYYNYYVYQYSTGISSAVAIVRRILDEGDPAAEAYLEALKLGGSEYPVDILAHAGVDVTEPGYLEDALAEYTERLDEMESLLGTAP